MAWQDFEDKAGSYLKSILEKVPGIVVEPQGGADSTLPDIKIIKQGKPLSNVEIKEPNSQAGQFVIKFANNLYEFSEANKVDPIPCLPIISHINNNIKFYLNVQQAGLQVNLTQTQMAKRIIYHYEVTKKSDFIITGNGRDFIVFPTKELENYFDIQCVIRRKKSGSRNIPLGKQPEVIKVIKENGFSTASFVSKGEKLYIRFLRDLHKEKIDLNDYEDVIYFSGLEKDGNVVKILSKTNNVNVIFTLTLKSNHPGNQLDKLLEKIKK